MIDHSTTECTDTTSWNYSEELLSMLKCNVTLAKNYKKYSTKVIYSQDYLKAK